MIDYRMPQEENWNNFQVGKPKDTKTHKYINVQTFGQWVLASPELFKLC